SMIRNSQVALIPVFQFGVFSESDLSFFPGPAMDFSGPVHTNGDLYLAGKATVTFHNQLSAYGNASVTGGGSSSAQPLTTYNGTNAWYTFSKNTTNHEIINGNYGSNVAND